MNTDKCEASKNGLHAFIGPSPLPLDQLRTCSECGKIEEVRPTVKEIYYLLMVRRVGDDLLKNARHSFGVDFDVLNQCMIETEQRLATFKRNNPDVQF